MLQYVPLSTSWRLTRSHEFLVRGASRRTKSIAKTQFENR